MQPPPKQQCRLVPGALGGSSWASELSRLAHPPVGHLVERAVQARSSAAGRSCRLSELSRLAHPPPVAHVVERAVQARSSSDGAVLLLARASPVMLSIRKRDPVAVSIRAVGATSLLPRPLLAIRDRRFEKPFLVGSHRNSTTSHLPLYPPPLPFLGTEESEVKVRDPEPFQVARPALSPAFVLGFFGTRACQDLEMVFNIFLYPGRPPGWR